MTMENNDKLENPFSREKSEELIALSFLPHLFQAAQTVSALHRGGEIPVGLTNQEGRALSKYTYFGWTIAVASGFGVFVATFGGIRYAKYLASRRPSFQISQPKHSTQTSKKRAEYSSLDKATSESSLKKSSRTPPPVTEQPKETAQDTKMNIQFIFCSALSLCVATITGNTYSDDRQVFNDNVAMLPLQTGASILCERYFCPKVLEHHRNLREQPITYEKLFTTIQEDNRSLSQRQIPLSGNDDDESESSISLPPNSPEYAETMLWRTFDQDPSIPTPNEVYNEAVQNAPATPALESMQRLVYHCECRQAFEQKCRQHGQAIDPRSDLINVPEKTGVPLGYLSSKGNTDDDSK